MTDDPDWLADDAEIVAEKETMMLIHSPNGSGKEYILDTGAQMIEFSLDEVLILDEMLDFWHVENAESIAERERNS